VCLDFHVCGFFLLCLCDAVCLFVRLFVYLFFLLVCVLRMIDFFLLHRVFFFLPFFLLCVFFGIYITLSLSLFLSLTHTHTHTITVAVFQATNLYTARSLGILVFVGVLGTLMNIASFFQIKYGFVVVGVVVVVGVRHLLGSICTLSVVLVSVSLFLGCTGIAPVFIHHARGDGAR
jgi:hypothetical protein